ncbi:hypothetical protein QZH41_016552 [Actinostola sp. cb2023]|nr:hypothetical protein QZH41_016552 [Actinostola sp. cb2023]
MESKSNPKRAVLFEDLWSVIGGFGRYPILLFAFMCYVTVIVDFQQFIQTYYGSAPNYQCIPWDPNTNNSCAINECGCSNCTYVFDDEFTSAVSEWMLICDRAHFRALSQSVFYGGLLVGSIGFGKFSDHFGRKPGLFLSMFLMVIFGFGSSFANSFTLFAVMRFGAGFATAGALLIRWIPETPSWLIANGKLQEAQKVLESFAAASGYKVDSKHLSSVIQDVKDFEKEQTADNRNKSGILDLVKTRKMRKRTLMLCYNWFVNSVVFYGITLNAKNLGGSFHLNVFILFAVGIPGVFALWVIFKKCGRRIGYSCLMLFCGLTSLMVLAVPQSQGDDPIIKVLAVFGVFSIMATFSGIYIYTSELNPTLLRNLGLGVGSMTSRVGGIIAPYIVYLNDFMQNLPFVVFGVMAFTAGFVALFLPETLFSPMPQTVDQVESWDEDYGLPCRKRTTKAEEVVMEQDKDEKETTAL